MIREFKGFRFPLAVNQLTDFNAFFTHLTHSFHSSLFCLTRTNTIRMLKCCCSLNISVFFCFHGVLDSNPAPFDGLRVCFKEIRGLYVLEKQLKVVMTPSMQLNMIDLMEAWFALTWLMGEDACKGLMWVPEDHIPAVLSMFLPKLSSCAKDWYYPYQIAFLVTVDLHML